MEEVGNQRDAIIGHLETLNAQVAQQMSLWHALRNGVIYGVGFIIGSTVVTAVVVSFVLQFLDGTPLADAILWIARMR